MEIPIRRNDDAATTWLQLSSAHDQILFNAKRMTAPVTNKYTTVHVHVSPIQSEFVGGAGPQKWFG